jgi:NADPH:quinone reductase-like Zn-dependent oxidoreductase
MDTREVWRISRAGSLDRLARTAEPFAEPAPGEARIRVHAVGLNFADLFACLGLYSATPKGAFVPGLEFAGVVEALGPAADASPLQPGDRVFGLTRFGGYATGLNIDVRYLRPSPDGWDFAEAAAFPVQGLTAWYALVELGGLKRGAAVLLHSAAGGVGLNALQILVAHDARVVATVGNRAKRNLLAERFGLTADQIIVRDRRDFGRQLDATLTALGLDGLDLVLDAVAGPYFRPAYDRLRPEGRIVVYGAADLMPKGRRPDHVRLALRYLRRPRLDPLRMVSENKSVMAFNLIWLWEQADRIPQAYERLSSLVQRPPLVGRRFSFADAPAALRYLQSGESVGKVVLEV